MVGSQCVWQLSVHVPVGCGPCVLCCMWPAVHGTVMTPHSMNDSIGDPGYFWELHGPCYVCIDDVSAFASAPTHHASASLECHLHLSRRCQGLMVHVTAPGSCLMACHLSLQLYSLLGTHSHRTSVGRDGAMGQCMVSDLNKSLTLSATKSGGAVWYLSLTSASHSPVILHQLFPQQY
jgi:hypothetical protein